MDGEEEAKEEQLQLLAASLQLPAFPGFYLKQKMVFLPSHEFTLAIWMYQGVAPHTTL